MRVPTWSVPLLLSIPAAACGGNDLTLPGPGTPAALRIVAGDDQPGTFDPASASTDADGHATVRARLGRQAGS